MPLIFTERGNEKEIRIGGMHRFRLILCCASLLLLTVAAYLPVWNNDFVDFDDAPYITANPQVRNGITWSGFCWAWKIERAPFWMPLTWLSFQLDAQLFSARTPEGEMIPSPAAFHAQNLFWHCTNTLLLFAVWRRMTGRTGASFLVAALFAVHPMHVESVAWAAERKDVLSAFFGILALGAYLLYVEKPSRRRYWLVFLALFASLLAKPMLLTFPFVLLLLDYWPLCRLRGGTFARPEGGEAKLGPASFKQLLVEKRSLFLLVAAVALATSYAHDLRGVGFPFGTLSFTARLANALTAYGWYLTTTFYPVRLAVLYLHANENWSLLPALAGAGIVLSVTGIACWQAARRPWLLVGWLWFAITLLPVIGFVQVGRQAWADRFSYWPHIGLFVALVWELAEWVKRFRVPAPISRLAGAAVLAGLAALTWRQVGYWRNGFTLWTQVLAISPDNDQAHEYLARYYSQRGESKEALYHLSEAVRIQTQRNQQFRR